MPRRRDPRDRVGDYSFGAWTSHVSVASRRRHAELEVKKRLKEGQAIAPVVIEGRAIAITFWGKAWCDNLERYSDYENRLPRGRSYLRNGSVIDLQVVPGIVTALVSGKELYEVRVKIAAIPEDRWQAVCAECAGAIDSVIELLQGRLSTSVMERMCRENTGLFPSPAEMTFTCSCPDWAGMCKHVAATLYGVGARLDDKPELLFTLRQVNAEDLIARAGQDLSKATKRQGSGRVLVEGNLSEIFDLDLLAEMPPVPKRAKPKSARPRKPGLQTRRNGRS
ncbi:MAG TPA: hypothetical protein VMZ90_06240 [Vicinamibacterales bacterium]|nr:hypothetical protein [Vicinamibacterales bacterium]